MSVSHTHTCARVIDPRRLGRIPQGVPPGYRSGHGIKSTQQLLQYLLRGFDALPTAACTRGADTAAFFSRENDALTRYQHPMQRAADRASDDTTAAHRTNTHGPPTDSRNGVPLK